MAVIKTAIELEDRVSKPLADVARSAEIVARSLNNVGTGGPDASGLNQYFIALKNGTTTTSEHTQSIKGLTGGYRILNLVLREAGIQVGGFRALSMAAQTGIVGLGVALTGAVAVGIEKLADGVAVVKQRLEDIAGIDIGSKLAQEFKQAEISTNSWIGAMAPAEEAITRAVNASKGMSGQWQTSGAAMKDFSSITKTWSEAIQLGKVNADDAAKAVNAIAQAIFKLKTTQGPAQKQTIIDFSSGIAEFKEIQVEADKVVEAVGLTFETFSQIEEISPGLGRRLSEAFGFKDIDAFRASLSQAPKTIDEVVAATERMSAATDKAYNSLTATDKTLGQNATDLKNAAQNAGSLAGKNIELGSGMESLTNQMKAFGAETDALQRAGPNLKAADEALDTIVASSDGLQSANSIVDALTEAFKRFWQIIITGSGQSVTSIDRVIEELILAKQQANSSPLGGGALYEPGVAMGLPGGWAGYAGGGLFRGRGGVDTNLAWLTHGEYIVPRHAVEHYGIQFLDWIRTLQFPIRGFAEGGLNLDRSINVSSPSISAMQSSRSLTLVLDTKRFNISGSKSTIDALEREATLRGISAAGIAPGWVR